MEGRGSVGDSLVLQFVVVDTRLAAIRLIFIENLPPLLKHLMTERI